MQRNFPKGQNQAAIAESGNNPAEKLRHNPFAQNLDRVILSFIRSLLNFSEAMTTSTTRQSFSLRRSGLAAAGLAASLATAMATTLIPGEAKASACTFPPTVNCVSPFQSTPVSDKVITFLELDDLTTNGAAPASGTLEFDYVDLGPAGLSHEDIWDFDVNFAPVLSTPGTYSLGYKIDIKPEFPEQFFKTAQLGILSTVGNNTITKQIWSDDLRGSSLVAELLATGTQNTGFVDLPRNLKTLYVLDTLTVVDSGVVNNFENGFQQGTQHVPGPLPLLGAGTAFGFSRKLRRRINGARQLSKV